MDNTVPLSITVVVTTVSTIVGTLASVVAYQYHQTLRLYEDALARERKNTEAWREVALAAVRTNRTLAPATTSAVDKLVEVLS